MRCRHCKETSLNRRRKPAQRTNPGIRAFRRANAERMCNLYSITTNQAAISALFRVVNRYVGNLAPMPGVFRTTRHRSSGTVTTAASSRRRAGHAVMVQGADGCHEETGRKVAGQGQAGRLQGTAAGGAGRRHDQNPQCPHQALDALAGSGPRHRGGQAVLWSANAHVFRVILPNDPASTHN